MRNWGKIARSFRRVEWNMHLPEDKPSENADGLALDDFGVDTYEGT